MAKKTVPAKRKSERKKSGKKNKENSLSEPHSPSGMTIELDSKRPSNSNRPWEEKKSIVTLSLKEFFATFHLQNGGFYDSIFELVGIKDFHSMTFRYGCWLIANVSFVQ
jgi:hypothetical protein